MRVKQLESDALKMAEKDRLMRLLPRERMYQVCEACRVRLVANRTMSIAHDCNTFAVSEMQSACRVASAPLQRLEKAPQRGLCCHACAAAF